MAPVVALFLALSCAALAAGFWLDRRYGAAIRYSGIGRPYPVGWSLLAFLGNGLMLLGLVGLAVSILLLVA